MMKILFAVLAFAVAAQATLVNSPPITCTAQVSDSNIPANATHFTGGRLSNSGVELNFVASPRYATVAFQFVGGNNAGFCAYPGQYWSYVADDADCNANAIINVTFPTTALGNCFAYDNTTNPRAVLYTTTIRVTATVNRASIRGDPITRTIVTAFRLSFSFQRYIAINASRFNATGPANTFSDIIEKTFNPIDRTLKVVLRTSVQTPYELKPHPTRGVTYDLADGGKVFNVTSAPYLTERATCDANAGVQGASCPQSWTTVFIPPNDACTWNPTITYYFLIVCNEFYTTVLGNPCTETDTNYTVTYTLGTENFCVQIVQDVTLTGTLRSFASIPNIANPVAYNNFLYNQAIYFRADITVTPADAVQVDYTEFISGTISSFNKVVPISPLTTLSNNFNFNYYNNIYSTQTSGFSFLINTDSIALSDIDNVQDVRVSGTFRVSYKNLNNGVAGMHARSLYTIRTVTLSENSIELLASGDQAVASLTSDFVVARPLSASTGTSSLVPAVAASAAGVALLTAFVAFVLYRRRTTTISKTQRTPPESKEESSTNSA